MRKVFHTIRYFSRFFVLTGRGFLFLALSFYAIRFLALPESDLLAWVLGGVAGFLPIFFAALTVFQTIRLKKSVISKAQFDSLNAFSGQPVKSGLRIYNADPLPFFEIELSRQFSHPGATSALHILRGAESNLRYIIDTVTFSHRGSWKLVDIQFIVRDRFGLSSLRFAIPCPYSCEVDAPVIPIAPLPIVASSSVSGDLIESLNNRSGDPFDLKQYDPSDGISLILWKTYAKSGELIVRRPEPSVVPDGEVAIYVVAGKVDDHVVGGFYSYFQLLQRSQIAVLFGTDATSGVVAVDEENIHRALNETVWANSAGTGKDFGMFLDTLSKDGRSVVQVLVFGPDDQTDWVRETQTEASRRSLNIEYALMPYSFRARPIELNAKTPKTSRVFNSSSPIAGPFHICQRSLG